MDNLLTKEEKELQTENFNAMIHRCKTSKRAVTVEYVYGSEQFRSQMLDCAFTAASSSLDIHHILNYYKSGYYIFNGYHYEDTVVFDFFNSQVPVTEMIAYLEGNPLNLFTAQTKNEKIACYTNVFIISSIPPEEQYLDIPIRDLSLRNSFLKCIDRVIGFDESGTAKIRQCEVKNEI